ncbi:beta-glucoside-specific PTS transporter subunit IIABC [Aquibacillus rhizosphaerae]|uniref:Beta-glucoside-specific PTS transporter subunit IIABC n=1 Tax=Aquibacillus rhizosphaerae TaxID=3051431 RepID=A0ABT7L534_9BACI|nr:beta-glucoside-specific PTS transporter subunit IIABC [Aquibacillus sp. LR5S19]MDL4840973.1 beta-glucoside-specific PTS transporter subunit IIABC [Aquibacillus sp. LR5S19]
MDHARLAKDIVKYVGGEENIISIGHCTTRLRFKLKSIDLVDKIIISKLPGVIKVMYIAGQFQIVIGTEVNDIYYAIIKMTQLEGTKNKESRKEDESLLNKAIDVISGIFTPLLGTLAGAGILKGLLIVAVSLGMLTEADGTYIIWHAAADSLFYFLPVHLAFTAAKKFGADPHVAVAIAGALFYPDLMDAYNQESALSFLGIPVVLMRYATSVIPIIIAIYVMAKIETVLNKVYPKTIKKFFTPLSLLAIMVPLTLLIFGPIGNAASEWLAIIYSYAYDTSALVAGALLGASWQILVIFGIHWGLVPIALNNLSQFGQDSFTAMITPAIFAQAGAALGVWFKTKQRKVKAIAAPAAIAGLFGVTEPAIYGITLRFKKPFIIGCIAGTIGGAIVGVSGASSKSVGLPGLTTLPIFFGDGFVLFIIGIVVAFLFALIATYLFGLEENTENEMVAELEDQSQEQNKQVDASIVHSPLTGPVLRLEDVNDDVFSSEAIGPGMAIIPIEGNMHAPFSGSVTSVFPSNHGIGLTSDSGIKVLIHIGIDTVQLEGKYFNIKVKHGDKVEQGQLLGTFDIEAITKEGFDITSPVVITNSHEYLDVVCSDEENTKAGDRLLTIVK